MRYLLLLLLIGTGLSTSAQLMPEHTYAGDTVCPISLRSAGAYYYRFDNAAKKVLLFNGSHQLLKVVNTPAAGTVQIRHVSEGAVNSDTLAEVLYDEQTSNTKIARVVNDTGKTLMATTVPSSSSRMDERPGLPPAVIVQEPWSAELFSVYRAPLFTRIGPFYFHTSRVNLDGIGEKILTYSFTGGGALHNIDGTLWKYLTQGSPPCAPGNGGNGEPVASRQLIDADTGLEYIWHSTCNYNNDSRIVRESGSSIITVSGSGNTFSSNIIQLSKLPNQSNKIIVNEPHKATVYAIPGMALEHTYNDSMYLQRISLSASGVKYWRYNHGQKRIELYNTDHTFWKAIPLAIGLNEQVGIIHNISEADLNSDPYVDVLYEVHRQNSPFSYTYFLKASNETGGVLTIADSSNNGAVRFHKYPDGTCKIAISRFTNALKQTSIYSMPITIPTGVSNIQTLEASVHPNPSSGEVILQFGTATSTQRVVFCYNVQGTLVYRMPVPAISHHLNLKGLTTGIYQIIIVEGDRRYCQRLQIL